MAPRTFLPGRAEEWLLQFKSEVEKHLTDPRFNAEFLAEALNISSRQMQRRLRKATGLSVNQYVQEVRLIRGRHLLESGVYLVKEAAAEVGFRDAHYFSTLYRERFGVWPGHSEE